jgi:cobalt-zinc-cadmium efflux system membrane fusion protein
MKKRAIYIFTFCVLVAMASCRQAETEAGETAIETTEGSQAVKLSQAQIDLAEISFGQIEQKLLSGDVDARGILDIPPDGIASVSPVIGGIVQSIEVFPGQKVNKGQVLASLTHPDYIDLQEQYLGTANSLVFLENDYQRQQRLFDEKVSSEKTLLESQTAYQAAKARLSALKIILGQLGIDAETIEDGQLFTKIPLRSPIEGMVNAINVNLGKNVGVGDELFEITCRNKLHLTLDVFEKDILKIENGQRVTFNLSNVDDKIFEARVLSIGGTVQSAGRIVKVVAEFENTGTMLFPGMFVASQIHTGEKMFDALPESALMNYGTGKPYIYYTSSPASSDEHKFNRMAVETGYEEDGYVHVILQEALPTAARIVTRGGYYIQSEEGN